MTSPIGSGWISRRLLRGLLLGVGIFHILSAVGGAIGLLSPGSIGIPIDIISSTGLTNYFWPAMVLLFIVGGTQAVAVVTQLKRSPLYLFFAAVAGFGMIIWIFVELAIMGGFAVLHGIYFASGTIQLVVVCGLLDILPGAVREPVTD